jgi:phytoene/squalene synthetase
MNTVKLYDAVCAEASGRIVRRYSTSFSIGIHLLHRRFRDPIKAIYGFVRFADEIVDTFHDHNKRRHYQVQEDTHQALGDGISLNPVLHSFQRTANTYGIDASLIDPFLASMEMDLDRKVHDARTFATYVRGSAEVVGLMCLLVFCEGDEARYERLKPAAMRLGSAFQKVNFLRDLQDDHAALGRTYFPGIDVACMDDAMKKRAEADVAADLEAALEGIRELPAGSRNTPFHVYTSPLPQIGAFPGPVHGRAHSHRQGRRCAHRQLSKTASAFSDGAFVN